MAMFDNRGDPKDLVKQHGGEARELFQRNYFGQGTPNIQPVDMKHVDMSTFTAEFVVKGEDLVLHFFRKDGATSWPPDFRSRIWDALLDTFKLKDHSDRLIIEWVPELFSWCVTIKKLVIVSAPDDELVLEALQRIE